MTGDRYVHAWILRLAATVLGTVEGDHLVLAKELEKIADLVEADAPVKKSEAEKPSDGFLPDDDGTDGWEAAPDIRDLELVIANKGWPDLDDEYIASIAKFANNGLSVETMMELSRDALGWRYFCGMCWRKIKG